MTGAGGTLRRYRVATTRLIDSPGHPFYQRLNDLLREQGFDRYVEDLCLA